MSQVGFENEDKVQKGLVKTLEEKVLTSVRVLEVNSKNHNKTQQ